MVLVGFRAHQPGHILGSWVCLLPRSLRSPKEFPAQLLKAPQGPFASPHHSFTWGRHTRWATCTPDRQWAKRSPEGPGAWAKTQGHNWLCSVRGERGARPGPAVLRHKLPRADLRPRASQSVLPRGLTHLKLPPPSWTQSSSRPASGEVRGSCQYRFVAETT